MTRAAQSGSGPSAVEARSSASGGATTVAVLGAGRLGQAFAGRLARSGFKVVLWHRNPEARESLARPEVAASVGAPPENVSVAATLDEAAERAQVLLVTVTARSFRDVIMEL